MRTLSSIQDSVRVLVRDTTYTITDNINKKHMGLKTTNQVYRKLCNLYKWPELSRKDTSISTTSGVSNYSWPISPLFVDIVSVEMKNSNNSNHYEIIPNVINDLDWNYFSKQSNNFPSVYRFEGSATEKQIAFAPTPDTNNTIRITGIIEPQELVSGDSTTIFSASVIDDVFEFLIAAERSFKQNLTDNAMNQIQRASSLLTKYAGKEITPQEIDTRVTE